MSCTQFHGIKMFILRHAWLNLWDKHMTTGRINQVTEKSPESTNKLSHTADTHARASAHTGTRHTKPTRPSSLVCKPRFTHSWMEKRTKLRTLAAHPTPPNPFCKARVPDRQLVPWLLCSLPDCHLTQHTATHASAHSGVGKQQPQLQGMVHPAHACLRTHELVRTHGLCESVARSMFPLASTHTDTPPAVTSTVTGTLPSFERSTY